MKRSRLSKNKMKRVDKRLKTADRLWYTAKSKSALNAIVLAFDKLESSKTSRDREAWFKASKMWVNKLKDAIRELEPVVKDA